MATYTDNYQLTLPGYADVADVADLNHNTTMIDEIMHGSQVSLAPGYDSTQTYNTGDVVMYGYKMYKCTADGVTGAWDPTEWEPTTASEVGGSSDPDYYGTASGDPASFADGAAAGLVKCETEIEPVQNLHGYAKPWPGGAGKNLLPTELDVIKSINTGGTWSGNDYTINGVTYSVKTDDGGNITGIEANGQASANADLSIVSSYNPTSDVYFNGCPAGGSASTYQFYISGRRGDYGSGSYLNAGESGRPYLRIFANYNAQNVVFLPMIRLQTESDATFAPYSNICPISGHDNVNITAMGKNLVNELYNGAIGADGGYSTTTRRVTNATSATSSKIKVEAGKYTISGDGLAYATVLTKDDEGNIVDNFAAAWNEMPLTFTITQAANLYFTCRKSDGTANINPEEVKVQIEKGETSTEIGPYAKITGVPLGSTVYGGTLETQTGRLTINKIYSDMGDLSWQLLDSSSGEYRFYADIVNMKRAAVRSMPIVCSCYKTNIGGAAWEDNTIWNSTNLNRVIVVTSSYTTAQAFAASVEGQDVVVDMESPQTVQLTPAQVASVLGQNYVSSDTGAVDVIYIKSAAPIIPNATGDSSGDLNSIGLGGKVFTIPKELPTPPGTDGAYKLRVTVTDGAPTFSWVSDT